MASTAIIFGATGAIGSDLARRLSERGFRTVLVARDLARLEALADSCGGIAVKADATQSGEVADVFRQVQDPASQITAVAHCVGSILLKPAHLTSDAEWMDTVNRNLSSAFFVLRESVKVMRKEGGSIALLSSAAGRLGISNHEAIAAAKAGIVGLVLSAAATYAPSRIRVNAVAPGLVESAMSERIVRNEASLRVSLSMHALGRIGQGSDVASALAWLLDHEQSWVTGQVLGVDGGLASIQSRGAA